MENIKGNIIVTELEAEELVEHIGETIQIHGSIYKIRKMKGFSFVLLRTRLYNFYKCQHCCRINCFKAFITTLDFMLVSIFLTKVV